MKPSRLSGSLGLALAFLTAAPALADLRSQIFVSNEILGVPTMAPTITAGTGPVTDEFFLFVDPIPVPPGGTLSISTYVDYGILRLESFDQTFADDFDMVMISIDNGTRATGSFSDTVTIDAVGRTGTAGTLAALVRFDGVLDAAATGSAPPFNSFGSATASLDFTMGSSQTIQLFRSCDTSVGTGAACLFGDAFGLQKLEPIAFTFGQPFLLSVQSSAATFSRTVPLGTTLANADLRFTIQWMGIQDVADAQGPVASFTLTSDSGVDWAQPVPEPRAAGLAGAAAALLALLGERRARQRA